MESYYININLWFDQVDKGICIMIMSICLLKIYVAQHRINEIFSIESMLSMIVSLPVLLTSIEEMSIGSDFFLFISISRYFRTVLFCVIMMKFHELGSSEVDR